MPKGSESFRKPESKEKAHPEPVIPERISGSKTEKVSPELRAEITALFGLSGDPDDMTITKAAESKARSAGVGSAGFHDWLIQREAPVETEEALAYMGLDPKQILNRADIAPLFSKLSAFTGKSINQGSSSEEIGTAYALYLQSPLSKTGKKDFEAT